MRLNNPSRMRKDYKQVKNEQNCRVSSTEKSSNGLPFGSFSRKNKICSSLARTISASRRSTFVHIYNISAFYWSNFDQTFWTQFFLDHDFCRPKCSWAKLLRTHIFLMQIFFSSPKMLGLTVFIPEILLDPKKKSNSIFFFTPNFF